MKKTLLTTVLTTIMMLVGTTTIMASENGWVEKGSNKWQYFKNGKLITSEWVENAGRWYFMDENGYMTTNTFINSDDNEVVDSVEDSYSTYYYVGTDGAMVTDWNLIEEKNSHISPTTKTNTNWYYFDNTGKLVTNKWIEFEDRWYAVGDNGKMLTNEIVYDDIEENSGDLYYVDGNGVMLVGWYKMEENDVFEKDSWIYANENGKLVEYGWKKINNDWFYFGNGTFYPISNDMKVSTVSGSSISFNLLTNALIESNDEIFYVNKNGYLTNGLVKFYNENNEEFYYYFGKNGVLTMGEETLNIGEYNIITNEENNKKIAINKDGLIITKGYAYTTNKSNDVFSIVEDINEVPENTYFYKLNSTNSIRKK